MPFDRIDRRRLKQDIHTTASACRDLKRVLRSTWTRPMADEQRALARLAWRMTELCVLRARMRGRWHATASPGDESWDREAWHARIADRVALDYTLPVDPPRAAEEAVAP